MRLISLGNETLISSDFPLNAQRAAAKMIWTGVFGAQALLGTCPFCNNYTNYCKIHGLRVNHTNKSSLNFI